jgi:hypothetical protein
MESTEKCSILIQPIEDENVDDDDEPEVDDSDENMLPLRSETQMFRPNLMNS